MTIYQLIGLAIDAEQFLAAFQLALGALFEDDRGGVVVADDSVGIFWHFGALHVFITKWVWEVGEDRGYSIINGMFLIKSMVLLLFVFATAMFSTLLLLHLFRLVSVLLVLLVFLFLLSVLVLLL
jgi:hypothetical protein